MAYAILWEAEVARSNVVISATLGRKNALQINTKHLKELRLMKISIIANSPLVDDTLTINRNGGRIIRL